MTDWASLGGDPAAGDPAAIRRCAQAWMVAADTTRGRAGQLHGQSAALSAVWRGSDDADTFHTLLSGPIPLLDVLVQTHFDVGAALAAYAAALEQAQQAAATVVAIAAAAVDTMHQYALEFAVAPDAPVTATVAVPNMFSPGHDYVPSGAQLAARAQAELRTCQQQAGSITAALDQASHQATAVLDRAVSSLTGPAGSAVTPGIPAAGNMLSAPAFRGYLQKFAVSHPPDLSGSATDIARRWAALDPSLRRTYIVDYPALTGGTDGIPVVDRDTANRRRLHAMATDLDDRLAALGPQPLPTQITGSATATGIGPPESDPPPMIVFDYRAADDWLAAHDTLARQLSGVQQLQARLADRSLPAAYLIDVRPSDGAGQAILATGNPDTARDVAVYVPGTSNDITNVAGSIARSDGMWRAAVTAGSPVDATAVVTWMGYQAPKTIGDATERHWADAAVTPLAHFLTGLRATHPEGRTRVR